MGRSSSRSRSRSVSRSRSHSRSRSADKDRKRRSSSHSPASDDENLCRVHIADLGLDPSKTEISKAFEKFGALREIWVARIPPCFAFVVYKYKDDANEAVRKMDGESLNGKRIRVSIAKPRMKGGRTIGGGRNRRCYDCLEFGHLARDCIRGRRRHRSSSRTREQRRSRSKSRSRSRSRRNRSRSRQRDRSGSRDRNIRRESRRSRSRDRSKGRERKDRSRSRERGRKDRRTQEKDRDDLVHEWKERAGSHDEKMNESRRGDQKDWEESESKSNRRSGSRDKKEKKYEKKDRRSGSGDHREQINDKRSGSSQRNSLREDRRSGSHDREEDKDVSVKKEMQEQSPIKKDRWEDEDCSPKRGGSMDSEGPRSVSPERKRRSRSDSEEPDVPVIKRVREGGAIDRGRSGSSARSSPDSNRGESPRD